MDKKNLVKLLDETFFPIGYIRRKNDWIKETDSLTSVVNLQKSGYSNSFYINYGFIIKGLELTTTLHVNDRFASADKEEQARLTELMDLENSISDDERITELQELLNKKIVSRVLAIKSEKDLLADLIKRPHLNDIPLVVKKHFNL
jgi:hypothetical protein